MGVLWDYAPPRFPDGLIPLPAIEHAAKKMRLKSSTWMVRSENDLSEALAAIERGSIEALMIMTNGGGVHHQPNSLKRLGDFLIHRRLLAITDVAATVFTGGGCVLAYSPNVVEMLVRLADFIDRILRGANPAELPFERPSRFDLAINMKTARAMGLAIPQSVLLRANSVID
jgi:putative ABC transport system substrate-binding protein